MQRLHVFSVRHLDSLQLTRFVELLTTTELFYDTRLIEFAFEFLNRALDVLTFFNRNDNPIIIAYTSFSFTLRAFSLFRAYSGFLCLPLDL